MKNFFAENPFQKIGVLISDYAITIKEYLHSDRLDHLSFKPDFLRGSTVGEKHQMGPRIEGVQSRSVRANRPIFLGAPVRKQAVAADPQTKRCNISFRLTDDLDRRIARELRVLPGTKSDFIRDAIVRALAQREQGAPGHHPLHNPMANYPILPNTPVRKPALRKRRKISFPVDDELDHRISQALRGRPGTRSEFIRNAIEIALKQNAKERYRAANSAIRWD
jgi:Arc/MetJ-type ribon-helix-helix transcriptional regulator